MHNSTNHIGVDIDAAFAPALRIWHSPLQGLRGSVLVSCASAPDSSIFGSNVQGRRRTDLRVCNNSHNKGQLPARSSQRCGLSPRTTMDHRAMGSDAHNSSAAAAPIAVNSKRAASRYSSKPGAPWTGPGRRGSRRHPAPRKRRRRPPLAGLCPCATPSWPCQDTLQLHLP